MFGFLSKKKSGDDAQPQAGEAAHPAHQVQPVQSPPLAVPQVGAAGARGLADGVKSLPVAEAQDQSIEIVVPPRHDPATILADFEKEIDRQEDRLYGIALFFECVSLLYAGRSGVLETNRKQFRNIIVVGHTSIAQARALAAKARQDHVAIEAVRAFRFTYCEGHPNPVGLAARADALLKAYRNLFPQRPPDKAFSEDETYRLLEASGNIIGPVLET